MRKTALPLVFVVAVGAALFYVSQENHGTGTLVLLAAVLLVGQICATLPFIIDAARSRTGTPQKDKDKISEDVRKIIDNQRVIHEDLRSLGETLVKRLSALSEARLALEKKIIAKLDDSAPDFDGEFEELSGKILRTLDDRLNDISEKIDEHSADEFERKFAESEEKILESLGEIAGTLDAVEEKISALNSREFAENDVPAEAEGERVPVESEDEDFSEVAEEENAADAPSGVEDFPEDDEEAESVPAAEETVAEEEENFPEEEKPAEEEIAGEQGELALGDVSPERGATLVLDAMLGIENRPFLRGNAPGLSARAGTPMTFVEIGRWSYDFAPFRKKISVRILRNDDEQDPLGEPVTLVPGQTLKIDCNPGK